MKKRRNEDLDNVIMDMALEGQTDEQIAATVGISPGRVRTVISYMQIGSSDLASGPGALMKASNALLIAIERAYPDGPPF